MATQCGDIVTQETQQLLDEAEERMERAQDEIAAEIAKKLPAIRETMAVRSLELLGENSDNLRERTEKQFSGNEDQLTDLQQITKDAWPTQQQLHEMVVEAEKVGMSDDEVICAPLICATPEAKGAETVIHDMLWAIENQDRIPYQHKDDQVFRKVVFVDKQEMGITGLKRADFDPTTKTLFIYKDADDKFPSKEEIRDQILPHEIFHGNSEKFMQILKDHPQEWKTAKAFGGVISSEYAAKLYELAKSGLVPEDRVEEEIAAELYRGYTNNQCLATTSQFFTKYFSE